MKILLTLLMATALLTGCERGYSVSGATTQLTPNVQTAIHNIEARSGAWLNGINSIVQVDQPPPEGVSWAVIKCSGKVILYNTTFDRPVSHMEHLLVHEAHHAQFGCGDDYDAAANAMDQCYRSGASYEQCLAKVEREFY